MAFNTNKSDICFLINSGPLPIHWAGWHTSTDELRNRGWEVLASERFDDYAYEKRVRVSVRSPDRKLVITGSVGLKYNEMLAAQAVLKGHMHYGTVISDMEKFPLVQKSFDRVEMECYTAHDRFVQVNNPFINEMDGLNPLSATFDTYRMSSGTDSIVHPRELKIFEYAENPSAIYIPSDNELLDQLLKVQYPMQQEIKKKLVLPETRPIIKAQIFTLAA